MTTPPQGRADFVGVYADTASLLESSSHVTRSVHALMGDNNGGGTRIAEFKRGAEERAGYLQALLKRLTTAYQVVLQDEGCWMGSFTSSCASWKHTEWCVGNCE